MKRPFFQRKSNGKIIREFSEYVDTSELVWHRDRLDRCVTVRSGKGWLLQLENELPRELIEGNDYFVPRNTYHRIIKGSLKLVVEIKES